MQRRRERTFGAKENGCVVVRGGKRRAHRDDARVGRTKLHIATLPAQFVVVNDCRLLKDAAATVRRANIGGRLEIKAIGGGRLDHCSIIGVKFARSATTLALQRLPGHEGRHGAQNEQHGKANSEVSAELPDIEMRRRRSTVVSVSNMITLCITSVNDLGARCGGVVGVKRLGRNSVFLSASRTRVNLRQRFVRRIGTIGRIGKAGGLGGGESGEEVGGGGGWRMGAATIDTSETNETKHSGIERIEERTRTEARRTNRVDAEGRVENGARGVCRSTDERPMVRG